MVSRRVESTVLPLLPPHERINSEENMHLIDMGFRSDKSLEDAAGSLNDRGREVLKSLGQGRSTKTGVQERGLFYPITKTSPMNIRES